MLELRVNHEFKKLVLVVTTLSTGGIGSYLASIAAGFKSRGWIVHCVVTNSKGNLFDDFSDNYVCHSLAEQVLSLKKVLSAAKLINELSPDVILLNHCSLFHYVLPFLNNNIKPIVILHSDDNKFYETAILYGSRIFKWIAPSAGVSDRFIHYLPDILHNRIRIISHGIDDTLFFPDSQPRINKHQIAFIGYIAENKGADLLPDIFSRIIKKCPDAHLMIVGDGPMQHKLQYEFGCRNLLENVSFTEVLSPAQVAELLRQTNIFLLPTRIEGFGLAIVEAMMCGVVPVVTNLEGITDKIITNNQTGFLVKMDDVDGFSSAIIDILSNNVRFAEMSEAAQKYAQEKFCINRMIDNYENLFAERDHRFALAKRGIVGWSIELLKEMMRKYPDGTFKFERLIGTLKQMINKKLIKRNVTNEN